MPYNIGALTRPVWPNNPSLLLHPSIPSGAAKMNPRTFLGKEWWDLTRKTAEQMNNYCCYACGVHKSDTPEAWIEGHEAYTFDYENRIMTYDRTVSLCKSCHSFIHGGLMLTRLVGKEIEEVDYVALMNRGVFLLRSVGLEPLVSQVSYMWRSTGFLHAPHLYAMETLVRTMPDEILRPAILYSEHPSWQLPWKLKYGEHEWTRSDLVKILLGPSATVVDYDSE